MRVVSNNPRLRSRAAPLRSTSIERSWSYSRSARAPMLALQRASVPSRPMIAAGDDGGEGTGGERVGETAWAARQDGDGAGSSEGVRQGRRCRAARRAAAHRGHEEVAPARPGSLAIRGGNANNPRADAGPVVGTSRRGLHKEHEIVHNRAAGRRVTSGVWCAPRRAAPLRASPRLRAARTAAAKPAPAAGNRTAPRAWTTAARPAR